MDALWCSSCTWGQMKAVFPSLLGVASLRLRRHAKGTCDFLIPHLHQWGTSGRYPMPFLALNGAVLPASIKMIGEPFFKSLSEGYSSDPRRRAIEAPVITCTALSSRWRGLSASDVLAPLLTPLTLWRNPPRRTGNRRTGCGITFQSNCHSPCAGLSPAIPMMGNRFCPTTWHQSPEHHHTDIPHRILAPLAHGPDNMRWP